MLIRVKVYTDSKKQEIVQKEKDSFEIKVKEKPQKGLANKEVIAVLAAYFNIAKSKIKLIKGHKQKNKIFEIPCIK
jgi:hypothetical protein